MRWKDLVWGLGYPAYQLAGTLRHEAAHALAAIAFGGRVTEFVIRPTTGFFGYVNYAGANSPFISAAPYLLDLLTFLLAFGLGMAYPFRWRWLWIQVVVLGAVSPLVNSAYNYNPWRQSFNDIDRLLDTTPAAYVHSYFIFTLALYAAGLILLFTRARLHGRPQGYPRFLTASMSASGFLALVVSAAYMIPRSQEIVYTDSFDSPSRRWTILAGDWHAADGVFQQRESSEELALAMLDLPERRCYTLSLRARILEDGEGLRLPFRYNGRLVWWKLGGPDRRLSYLEGVEPWWVDVTFHTLESGRWYAIEIRVNRTRAAGWLDGERLWVTDREPDEVLGLPDELGALAGLVGVGSSENRAEFDDIRVTRTCSTRR